MKIFIKQIISKRYALSALLFVELNNKVAATRFGIIWWILDPLILMIVYYFLVHLVLGRGGPDFHTFVLSGIVCFQYFSRSLTGCTNVLTTNQGLIRQTDLPLVIYVLINPLTEVIYCLFGIIVIILFVPSRVGFQTLFIFPLILLISLITITSGLFLSVLNVYIRDTSNFIRYIIRILFFFSPVLYGADRIYDSEKIPQIIKYLYEINPLATIIPAFRSVLLYGKVYDIFGIFVIFIVTLIFLEIGLIFFRKTENQIVKML